MRLLFWTVVFAALDTGMAFAHALELIPKMSFDAGLYLTLHRTLYWGFGTIGAVIDVAVLPLTIVLAVRMRRSKSFKRAAFTAACYVLAFVLWVALINPANIEMKSWPVNPPPSGWTVLRDRWEYTHLARFGIQLAGLAGLVLLALGRAERRKDALFDAAA